jgi:hypothetical protein
MLCPKRKNVRCSNADTSRLGDQIWAVNSAIQPYEDECSQQLQNSELSRPISHILEAFPRKRGAFDIPHYVEFESRAAPPSS